MHLKNMLKRLTWNYNKNEESNIYKLFACIAPEIEFLKELLTKVESWRGTDNAQGKTLDLIGEDVRQERLGMSDNEYRPMLKFRSSLNRSNTDINSVNNSMKSITNNNYLRLYEGPNHPDYNEPASIIVSIKEYTDDISYNEIDKVLAAGVRAIWRVEKEAKGGILIATALTCGEEITVYPYDVREITVTGKMEIATGYNTGYEIVEVKARR